VGTESSSSSDSGDETTDNEINFLFPHIFKNTRQKFERQMCKFDFKVSVLVIPTYS